MILDVVVEILQGLDVFEFFRFGFEAKLTVDEDDYVHKIERVDLQVALE